MDMFLIQRFDYLTDCSSLLNLFSMVSGHLQVYMRFSALRIANQ